MTDLERSKDCGGGRGRERERGARVHGAKKEHGGRIIKSN